MRSDESDFANDDSEDSERDRAIRAHLNPTTVDQSVRQALQMCWMILPSKKKTADELETQFRRIVDRAIRDMRDDFDSFGF